MIIKERTRAKARSRLLPPAVHRSKGWAAGLLISFLASCYDAPRTNPFDPALTPAVELQVALDDTAGVATLTWSRYEGQQPFAEYRVLRQVRDRVTVDTLMKIPQVQQTTFRDTTLQPGVVYGYWVEVVNLGEFAVGSEKHEGVVYALPSIELLSAEFSSNTATAALVWSQYWGPGFEAYEVRRKAPELEEKVVAEIEGVHDTTYTDTFLDGNTEYTYHIAVRTEWEGVGMSSNEKQGAFYPFDHSLSLPVVQGAEPQAVALAVDEQDRLYVGMKAISLTGEFALRAMKRGIWVSLSENRLTHLFENILPAQQSPIRVAAGQGKVYGCVGLENGATLIWALDTEGQILWVNSVDTGGAFPVGLHLEENGELVIVDERGVLYPFSLDGQAAKKKDSLYRELERFKIFPLTQVVVGPGVGRDGLDWYFLLSLNMKGHRVIASVRYPNGLFDARDEPSFIDEGIGIEGGKLLTPIAMVFDRQRQRLLVFEDQGRVQVFDGRWGATPRYITQWGRFGTGEGEFLVSSFISVALVVDSRGMIYVADGAGRIQVFSP